MKILFENISVFYLETSTTLIVSGESTKQSLSFGRYQLTQEKQDKHRVWKMVSNSVNGEQDYDRFIYMKYSDDFHAKMNFFENELIWYIGSRLGEGDFFKSEKHTDHHHDDPTSVDKWQVLDEGAYVDDPTLKIEYEATHIGMFVC